MTCWSAPSPTRSTSESWWSNARWTPGWYGRFVVMSVERSSTLPSCMSFGWTNRMSSSIPSCLSSAAHTRPSKSERVTSRCWVAVEAMVRSSADADGSLGPRTQTEPAQHEKRLAAERAGLGEDAELRPGAVRVEERADAPERAAGAATLGHDHDVGDE